MPDRDITKGLGRWARTAAGDATPDPKDGDQTPDPEGENVIASVPVTLTNMLRDLQRAFMNMHRCNNLHKCLNADLVDGMHWLDIKEYIDAGDVMEFPLRAPDDAPAAQYSFDGAATPGSTLAGMGFDSEFAEGPALKDTQGDAQLQVKIGEIVIQGKLTVGGLIDPTGLELAPVAANPGGTAANTLWMDSGDGNRLKHGAQLVGEISGAPTNDNLLSWSSGSKRVQDSGYAASDFAAALHSHSDYLEKTSNLSDLSSAATARVNLLPSLTGNTLKFLRVNAGETDVEWAAGASGDMLAANNLSDVASDDDSIKNLITGATNRAPTLSTEVPGYNFTGAATSGGALTLQQIYDRINDLSSGTPVLTDPIPYYNTGGKKTTQQALFNLLSSLTAETAPAYNDKVALYDTSAGQTDAMTIATLFGEGKAVIEEYTGSGSSGKTVTLTGINRASTLVVFNQSSGSSRGVYIAMPNQATGAVTFRSMANGSIINTVTLNAPAAGTSQVMTINNTSANFNATSNTYRVLVIGTPI